MQEKSGFVPNVFVALAARPDEFRAFFAYHDALMEKPGGLTKAEREMIVVATSAVNHCQYCVVAHGAILRIRAKDPLIADQVSVNYLKADLTERQRAMLDFAVKVAERSHEIEEEDYETLGRARIHERRRLGHRRPSRPCSPCRTASPTRSRSARTPSSSRWGASLEPEAGAQKV